MKEKPTKTKTVSAGVVVTNGTHILLAHVTGGRHWDIPKGMVDPGETDVVAAARELHEETSLEVDASRLIPIGVFPYKKHKDLSLWLYKVDAMPDPRKLDCLSTFNTKTGITKKEMDDFAVVPWDKVGKLVVPDMWQVLKNARIIINELPS